MCMKLQKLLSLTRKCDADFNLIEKGDRVAVGLSGGKDSVALLCALAILRKFYPKPFSLIAITVDMGLPGMDFSPMRTLCEGLDVPYFIVESRIAEIVFEHRREENPCSLCAKLRRGILFDEARKQGCHSIALGHHEDDAAVTFLMNLFNEGRIGCFSPVTEFQSQEISLIRPLLYADEDDIRYFVRKNALPVIVSACPEDKHTDRERYAELLRSLERERRGTRHRIIKAMEKAGVDGFKDITKDKKDHR